MGEKESQLVIYSHQIVSSTGNELYLTELLAKGAWGNLQTTQIVAKNIGFSPTSDSMAPLLNVIPTQLFEQRDFQLVPT